MQNINSAFNSWMRKAGQADNLNAFGIPIEVFDGSDYVPGPMVTTYSQPKPEQSEWDPDELEELDAAAAAEASNILPFKKTKVA